MNSLFNVEVTLFPSSFKVHIILISTEEVLELDLLSTDVNYNRVYPPL